MLDRQTLCLFVIILCGSVQGNSVVFNTCMSQRELSEEEALTALENWPDVHDLSLVEHSYKCFMTCVLMDLGVIDKSGQVQIDKYVKSGALDRNWVAIDMASCRSKHQDEMDMCEYVFALFSCFRESLKN